VCTFRRPELLSRLLDALASQVPDPSFRFDVVVIDNDRDRSAQQAVRRFQLRGDVDAVYDCEPEQNISLARNRAIRNATGNLVAFLDDDEYPAKDWLAQLHRTLKMHNASGVLGPVLPDFPPDAPRWLERGRFFRRRRLPTGTSITSRDARTGNVLLRRSIFTEYDGWFDPAFGRTGGEDSDFFLRQFETGGVFVWCDEAIAYETVPPERWKVSFHLKRYLLSGTVDGELVRVGKLPATLLSRNFFILCACVTVAPLSLLMRKHFRVRVLQKLAYCGGILTASCGLSLVRHRD
jgi:succinoglycan biosynthesis protein ExoM